MSIVIGFNLIHYALLVADTRISYYPKGGHRYRDNEPKVRRTTMGLISGAGVCEFLDPVTDALASTKISNTGDFIDLVRAQRKVVDASPIMNDAFAKSVVDKTAWMVTYVTFPAQTKSEMTPELAAQGKMRLAVTNPADNYELSLLKDNSAYVMPPTSLTEEELEKWSRFLNDSIRPITPSEEIGDNLLFHIGLAAAVIREVAKTHPSVSPTFQAGFQTLSFSVGISSIVGEDGRATWEFSDTNGDPPRRPPV